MCTVSFIARKHGYLLAMNRDEKLTRVQGVPPKIISCLGRKIVCPSEPGGGTWIALNDAGVTYALINWYSVTARVKKKSVSRGEVVSMVSAQVSSAAAAEILAVLPLKRMNPFRLIGVFPATQEVVEWRWNLKQLNRRQHLWRAQPFISSGFDESTAQRIRSATFRLALRQKSAGTRDWLRRLHHSQAPEPGPFAICMQRADAATVSYTEIMVSSRTAMLNYQIGPVCRNSAELGKPVSLAR